MFDDTKKTAASMMLAASLTAGAAPWQSVAPAEAGYDEEKLAALPEFIRDNSGCTSMLVAVDGAVAFTYGDIAKVSVIASCRKSVLGMLYGKYVENGTIDLGLTVGELGIDDLGGLLPQEKLATVYDLITSRSGVYHVSATLGGDTSKFKRGKTSHGTKFVYNNWDFNVAGTVFTMLTGKGIYKAFNEELAIPLGLEDYDHASHKLAGNAALSKHLGYHFYLSARDMARLGELMRLNGAWNGRTLVPESWIRRSTSLVSPDAAMPFFAGYGCMWWILDSDKHPEFAGGFSALGMGGQYILVAPKLRMVVAFKSADPKKRTSHKQFFAILDRLLAARKKAADR